ncbi:hypothetical protein FA13DRAFT_1899707 [Coprinellus micaceus]|uniref:CxC2-like cysteine cluster KDZ transposase-associated domain-containing protein n=1 Tax=Coprinellus micaceus TaxID=71717 RepID=A0A4Y7SUJ3_COPMI|nr:hypothetical protein FA13DRAFT_1899707 [Coprinellus micaceus]
MITSSSSTPTACHPIGLDYCDCLTAPDPVQQLLRERLFPATTVDPHTAASFRVLETFQMLSFTGKISAYEFLIAIMRRTDNTWNMVQGRGSSKDKHPDFMWIVHEWRILRMFKRFARGHDNLGVKNTKQGECALRCPACPLPGINMPKWENIPRKKRWLFALFLAIDANFRLRRKDVSSDERDPGLINGYAYIVAEQAYKAYLARFANKPQQVDESTCSNYDAIKSANVRGGPGIAASGMGTVLCRHDFHRPTSSGDLLKGERYNSMDYFFLSSLSSPLPQIINVLYDIACQWEINLPIRCNSPEYDFQVLKGDHGYQLAFFVPKFHLPAHRGPCVHTHSFNLRPGVGRTDREQPERGWAWSNRLAAFTMEMGPGNRPDTIDDANGDRNWQQTVEQAHNLSSRANVACAERNISKQAFREFAGGATPKDRAEWTNMAREWEADISNENPYKNDLIVSSPDKVKALLQKEDDAALIANVKGIVHRNMSMSSFIMHGVEIGQAQARHEAEVSRLSPGAGSAERTRLFQRGIALHVRIKNWVAVQAHFAPGAAALRQGVSPVSNDSNSNSNEVTPWSIALCLPSDPGALDLYDTRAKRYEFIYHISEAETALSDLRGAILFDRHMARSRDEHSLGSGTTLVTRSIQIIQDVRKRISDHVDRYRKARERLVVLWGALSESELDDMNDYEDWAERLEPLKDDDIRGPTALDDEVLGEGFKILTWIWTVRGTGSDPTAVAKAGLWRVEFCRARARAHRWQEECLLLAEEMRRSERYLLHRTGEWDQEASDWAVTLTTPVSADLPTSQIRAIRDTRVTTAGKVAYAHRQAAIWTRLHARAVELHGDYVAQLQSDTELIECDS